MPKRQRISGWVTISPSSAQFEKKSIGWKVVKPPQPIPGVKCNYCCEMTQPCGQNACLECCHRRHSGWKYCAVYCAVKASLINETVIPYDLIDLIMNYASLYYHCVKCGKKSENVYAMEHSIVTGKPTDLYECSMCCRHFHRNCCACRNVISSSYGISKIVCAECVASHSMTPQHNMTRYYGRQLDAFMFDPLIVRK